MSMMYNVKELIALGLLLTIMIISLPLLAVGYVSDRLEEKAIVESYEYK